LENKNFKFSKQKLKTGKKPADIYDDSDGTEECPE
jgi:hypothetical protein